MTTKLAAFLAVTVLCAATAHAGPLTPLVLNTLWRINLGPDGTTTSSPAERDAHATEGALYYLPAQASVPGTIPLYRLINPVGTDHMDSPLSNEGGYREEGPLGYMYTSSRQYLGLVPIIRGVDSQAGNYNSGDHALLQSGDSTHAPEVLSYYSQDGVLGYGYARYLSQNTSLLSVTGGGVTVNSNANTGGAVWEWWWNGTNFINDYDYGRQLSMTVVSGGSALDEAGDWHGAPSVPVYARHPAPTLSVQTSGKTQSTRAIPIEWTPESFGGGPENPVIYPNAQIGKNLSLDWMGPDHVEQNWPLALYQSFYSGPALSLAAVEAPTAYLNTQFDTYYQYNPVTDTLSAFLPTQDVGFNLPGSGPNAVIVASSASNGALAMGAYENSPNAGIVVYKNLGSDGGEAGSSFSKWGVNYYGAVTPSWTFRTWIATDSVANIQAYFRKLYRWGVTSQDGTHDTATSTYDPVFYLAIQPDLAKAFGPTGYASGSVHWYSEGLPVEGRRGSPEFDAAYYLSQYPDLAAVYTGPNRFAEAESHYRTVGLPIEGRRGSFEFDVQYYLQKNPDLAAAFTGPTRFQDAANHWMTRGLPIEGRTASPGFSAQDYLNRYPDLKSAYGTSGFLAALEHWVTIGKAEGRNGR